MTSILARAALTATFAAALGLPTAALPQAHDHQGAHQQAARTAPADSRQAVRFPEPLRSHTLANMRDHLLALAEIQAAMSRADLDAAAMIAEQRLGMSSLRLHGAHDVARFMPQGMQDAGTAMHRSASQFALAAKDASASGDWKPALGTLSRVTQTCVACHAGYRLD